MSLVKKSGDLGERKLKSSPQMRDTQIGMAFSGIGSRAQDQGTVECSETDGVPVPDFEHVFFAIMRYPIYLARLSYAVSSHRILSQAIERPNLYESKEKND